MSTTQRHCSGRATDRSAALRDATLPHSCLENGSPATRVVFAQWYCFPRGKELESTAGEDGNSAPDLMSPIACHARARHRFEGQPISDDFLGPEGGRQVVFGDHNDIKVGVGEAWECLEFIPLRRGLTMHRCSCASSGNDIILLWNFKLVLIP